MDSGGLGAEGLASARSAQCFWGCFDMTQERSVTQGRVVCAQDGDASLLDSSHKASNRRDSWCQSSPMASCTYWSRQRMIAAGRDEVGFGAGLAMSSARRSPRPPMPGERG